MEHNTPWLLPLRISEVGNQFTITGRMICALSLAGPK